ncbi:MAG: peptidase S8 [Flavobacteriaceae bacterium]|nr:peptidase S8 [Flavobacteriaceae bacterium]
MKKSTFSSVKSFGILVLLLVCTASFAQQSFNVHFQDETIEMPENITDFQWANLPESAQLANGYVGWIQFYEIPQQSVQDRFKNQNFELLEYIGNKTYLFYTPASITAQFVQNNGVRSIIPVQGSTKISEDLKNGNIEDYAIQGDKLLVTLEYHKLVDATFVTNDLAEKQISVAQQYKGSNIIDLVIPNNCLEELTALPYVKWVELIIAPSIPDDTRGRNLHRSSGLDTQTTAGRNYTGEGIGVMVRDDGIVGPHIDFQGRIDNSNATGTGQTHGDGVGGIMAGAGNLNPTIRGMAAGSDVYVVNYQSNFLDSETVNLINDGSVQITNSSYSNGCNDGYTTTTRTVDLQTQDITSLLHVFSAGNSNNNNCGYGAGNQWGNITGGHKQGKNVIATANVFFDGTLVNSSSRGPAHDGRIKPDIAANGQNQLSTNENNGYLSFGGTSGAAPGIAGVSAQLYEVYGDANGGALPPSGLIKATLLNTADDYGNVGPDYKFGWGIVNGLRAGKLLEEDRYLISTVSQGNTNTHNLTVPAGTTQVRFMVYWTDEPATAGANTALVNDLDLVVTDPASNTYEPWILDPTPNPATLDLPATNGPDHLNNVEQVLINNPSAGTYDIDISGFSVPMGPQEYFIVYEYITENLTVTYPQDGESLVPGENETLHWDAVNTTSDFTLEFSSDNGASWNTITTVDNDIYLYEWTVPNNITGEAKFRVTSGAFQDESDGNFSIASQVTGLEFSQVCPDSVTFAWDEVPNAENYDVYILGTKYMEVVGNSATNSLTVPIANPNDEIWAAIVAHNDTEGWSSRRTIAINHGGGLVNCSLNADIAIASIDNALSDFNLVCAAEAITVRTTVRNTGINPQSNFTVSYQLSGEAAVDETFTGTLTSGQQEVFEFATPLEINANGNYTLTVTADLPGDQNINNNEKVLAFYAFVEATAVDFQETFETNGFPPTSWAIANPDDDDTWEERTDVIGVDGSVTTAAYLNNYNYNADGEEDTITTEIFDLTDTENAVLTFDLAKAQYSNTLFDGLRVEISADCGTTYETVYEKTNLELSTIPNYETSIWEPGSGSDWRTEQIELTDYEGGTVQVRFININNYGNSTFIDNINVMGEEVILETQDNVLHGISLYPNPTEDRAFVDFGTIAYSTAAIKVTNSLGQTITRMANLENTTKVALDVSNYATGLYFVTITADGQTTTKKLLVK